MLGEERMGMADAKVSSQARYFSCYPTIIVKAQKEYAFRRNITKKNCRGQMQLNNKM